MQRIEQTQTSQRQKAQRNSNPQKNPHLDTPPRELFYLLRYRFMEERNETKQPKPPRYRPESVANDPQQFPH